MELTKRDAYIINIALDTLKSENTDSYSKSQVDIVKEIKEIQKKINVVQGDYKGF